jgi:hypothetical protein
LCTHMLNGLRQEARLGGPEAKTVWGSKKICRGRIYGGEMSRIGGC